MSSHFTDSLFISSNDVDLRFFKKSSNNITELLPVIIKDDVASQSTRQKVVMEGEKVNATLLDKVSQLLNVQHSQNQKIDKLTEIVLQLKKTLDLYVHKDIQPVLADTTAESIGSSDKEQQSIENVIQEDDNATNNVESLINVTESTDNVPSAESLGDELPQTSTKSDRNVMSLSRNSRKRARYGDTVNCLLNLGGDCQVQVDETSLKVDKPDEFPSAEHFQKQIVNLEIESSSNKFVDISMDEPKESYIVEPRILPPTAKQRKLLKEKVEEKPTTPVPDIGLSYSCLNYMAIINHTNKKCLPVDIMKFVLYYFPELKMFETEISVPLGSSRTERVSPWIQSTKLDGKSFLWSVKQQPSQLSKWKQLTPNGLRQGVKYADLIDGKVISAFDIDGYLIKEEEDTIPIFPGTDYILELVMEELISRKNNPMSAASLTLLIQEKFPTFSEQTTVSSQALEHVMAHCPWFVKGEKINGRRGHFISIVEENKGMPLLSRESQVPPVIFNIIKDADNYGILDNDSGTSWYFFEIDEDGKEVKDEESDDRVRLIHVKAVNNEGKHKCFVSFCKKKNSTSGENEYAFNFGATSSCYVTKGHTHNMKHVEGRMEQEANQFGTETKSPSSSRPSKITRACGGVRLLMNEQEFDGDIDDVNGQLWNTNYHDALILYSGSSHRVIQRVRNMMREVFVSFGKDCGYHPNWSIKALQVITQLPFTRNINYEPPTGSLVH